ncbi:MAG: hypothetical protein NTNFB02_03880 [Nitrospira sp.]
MVGKIINTFKREGVCGVGRAISVRLLGKDLMSPLQQYWLTPKFAVDPLPNTRRLGTEYGGWDFVEDKRFYGGTVISCGLGEDASFDVEFASRYNATVIVVDPTVRAIKHFDGIMTRIGMGRETSYVEGGNQPVKSYDLSKLGSHNLHLVPKAIWTHNNTVEFFAPPDPSYVSHSIVDFQNNYSRQGPSCDVECITIDKLLQTFSLSSHPVLLKLDIEGAQRDVIRDMISKGIYPSQILVEFEELQSPSLRGKRNFEEIDRLLRKIDYRLRVFSPPANFAYTRTV